jgi:MFS family permease
VTAAPYPELPPGCAGGPNGLFRRTNYIAALAMDIFYACVGLGLSLRAALHFRMDYREMAFLFATGGLAAGLGCFGFSKLADRFGRRPLILISLVGSTAAAMLYTLATERWHLFVILTGQGLSAGMFWPSLEARITDGADGRVLTRRLGLFGIAFCAGLLIGDPVSGGLFDLNPLAPFFFAAAVAIGLLGLLLVQFRRDDSHDGHVHEPRGNGDQPDEVLPDARERRAFMLAAWVANGVAYAITAVLMRLFPRFASLPVKNGGLGFEGLPIGLINGTASFAMLLGFLWLGRRHFWHYRLRYLVGLQGVACVGLLLYATSTTLPLFVLGAFLFGSGRGLAYLASIYYSLHAQSARAGQSGLHETIICFGFATGVLAVGLAADYLQSHRVPFWLGLGATLAAMVMETTLVLRARRNRT